MARKKKNDATGTKDPQPKQETNTEPGKEGLTKSSKRHPVKQWKRRTFEEDVKFLHKCKCGIRVDVGFVPNMRVPAYVIVNDELEELLLEELKNGSKSSAGGTGGGGFLPALKQVANVAALPGIVKGSYAMPDVHSGYGFCIGNVAAFDMNDEESVVSPGGVGFDINCGVRLIRTNLTEADVMGQLREDLCQALFDHIPVGVGQNGVIPLNGNKDMDDVLLMGIDFSTSVQDFSTDQTNCNLLSIWHQGREFRV